MLFLFLIVIASVTRAWLDCLLSFFLLRWCCCPVVVCVVVFARPDKVRPFLINDE